jgi:hypothetical protein
VSTQAPSAQSPEVSGLSLPLAGAVSFCEIFGFVRYFQLRQNLNQSFGRLRTNGNWLHFVHRMPGALLRLGLYLTTKRWPHQRSIAQLATNCSAARWRHGSSSQERTSQALKCQSCPMV